MPILQYITHRNGRYDYADGALMALKGGCRWIQLRMKDASDDEVRRVASLLVPICRHYGATIILDDRVDLVGETGADGVHLGKNDMPVREARQRLGGKIIGGTANTFDDVRRLTLDGADYIGCGPFRFTTTKAHLSPILGIEGYREIIRMAGESGLRHIPIIAIGGIVAEDICQLMAAGVDGIAISGAILNADDPTGETMRIVELINNETRPEI